MGRGPERRASWRLLSDRARGTRPPSGPRDQHGWRRFQGRPVEWALFAATASATLIALCQGWGREFPPFARCGCSSVRTRSSIAPGSVTSQSGAPLQFPCCLQRRREGQGASLNLKRGPHMAPLHRCAFRPSALRYAPACTRARCRRHHRRHRGPHRRPDQCLEGPVGSLAREPPPVFPVNFFTCFLQDYRMPTAGTP